MPQFLLDIVKMCMVLIPFILSAESTGAEDADKRLQVIAAVDTVLDAPGGLDRPSFIPKDWFDWLIGLCVDQMVKLVANSGFLKK